MTSSNGNIFALLALCVGIHRSPLTSPHKGQWRVALMFSLVCARINGWVNNREAGNLRRHCTHYDVTVMDAFNTRQSIDYYCNPLRCQQYISPCLQANRLNSTLLTQEVTYYISNWRIATLIHRPPWQNGRHFADDIFRCISLNEMLYIFIKISLNFVPVDPIDNNTALV